MINIACNNYWIKMAYYKWSLRIITYWLQFFLKKKRVLRATKTPPIHRTSIMWNFNSQTKLKYYTSKNDMKRKILYTLSDKILKIYDTSNEMRYPLGETLL